MRLCNSPIRNSFPLKKDIHIKITHEKWQLKNYFLYLLFHVIQVITIILTYSTYVFNYLEEKSKIKKKKKIQITWQPKNYFVSLTLQIIIAVLCLVVSNSLQSPGL